MKSRIEWEKRVVANLVGIYCRGKRHESAAGGILCPSCSDLLLYAHSRLAACPYGETKSFCGSCHIQCYETGKREQIRQVMRFSGPRLLLVSPMDAIRHLIGR